jgi:hypothetical protein
MIPLGHTFRVIKGSGKGTPSPLFFSTCLTRMVVKSQQRDLITGLIDHLIDKGVAILQYADDTVMCLQK